MKPSKPLVCDKPDRDVPRMKCGYPLPCPYHTAIIDVAAETVHIPVRVGAEAAVRIKQMADALTGKK